MTALSFAVLLFVANLVVYKEAAMLVPFTGGLCLILALWQLRVVRRRRAELAELSRRGGRAASRKPGAPLRGQAGSGPAAAGDMFESESRGARAGLGLGRQSSGGGKSGKHASGQEKAGKGVAVQREGNVLYASFPSTKEGRRKALEAFSKEKPASSGRDGQPLQ